MYTMSFYIMYGDGLLADLRSHQFPLSTDNKLAPGILWVATIPNHLLSGVWGFWILVFSLSWKLLYPLSPSRGWMSELLWSDHVIAFLLSKFLGVKCLCPVLCVFQILNAYITHMLWIQLIFRLILHKYNFMNVND